MKRNGYLYNSRRFDIMYSIGTVGTMSVVFLLPTVIVSVFRAICSIDVMWLHMNISFIYFRKEGGEV